MRRKPLYTIDPHHLIISLVRCAAPHNKVGAKDIFDRDNYGFHGRLPKEACLSFCCKMGQIAVKNRRSMQFGHPWSDSSSTPEGNMSHFKFVNKRLSEVYVLPVN